MRVNELSKELGKTNKEVLEILKKNNYDVKSHASNITEEQVAVVKRAFGAGKPAPAEKPAPQAPAAPQKEAPAPAAATPQEAPAQNAPQKAQEGRQAQATPQGQPQKRRIAAVFRPQNSAQRPRRQGGPGMQQRPGQERQGQRPQGRGPISQQQPQRMPVRDNREDELRAQKAREAQAAEEAAKAKAAEEARAAAEAAAKAEAQKAAEEAQKAAEKKAEPAPAPAPQEPAKPAPRTFSGPIVPTRPAFNPRPINRPAPTGDGQRNQNRDGNRGGNFQNRDGRPGYQNRDGNRGGNFQNRDGNRPGFQNRDGNRGGFQNRDGNRPGFQNRDGSRPGFQNRDGNRPGFQNRDGRPASQGGRGFYDKDKDADTQSRGGQGRGPQSGRPGGRPQEGGFGDRPLQKQQNNKQNKNAYKDKNSRFDRDEEKRGKGKGQTSQKQAVKAPVQKPEPKEPVIKTITLPEKLTIRELAEKMKLQPAAIVKKLFMEGQIVTINQEIEYDKAEEIALMFDVLCEQEEKVDVIAELLKEDEEAEETLEERAPVVCVMGHVDHGKTSLLDAIRETNVTAKEAGGITQRIGAYMVETNGHKITFLDTPGHEAFTAMRMRGAQSTDIAVLVVAADDGVMPQTVEAINHAKAAGVDLIVAINKMDKPGANPDRVKQELSQHGILTEDWGGDVPCVEVSAKTKQGIPELLDMILLVAEVKELRANPNRNARGLVIEASLDKGRGPVATILIQKGTLHVGDPVAAGHCFGKVRAMTNENGRRLKEAGPSTPVEIIGLNDVPSAGEVFMQLDSEKEARSIADTYIAEGKKVLLEGIRKPATLDGLFAEIQAGNVKELPIIVKADVQGSVEAVKQSLVKLSNEEVAIKVIHSGVGAITESDASLASASGAIIIGFNVRPDATAKSIVDREKLDMRLYKVIYQAIDDVEAAMKGMLEPIYEERVIGHGVVRQTFKASKVGTIAGTYILDGKFTRGCKARITRDGEQIFDGEIISLKRFKDDVKDVNAGYECGVVFDKFEDLREEDTIEAYAMVEVPRS